MMQVKDVMSSTVIRVCAEARVADAVALMQEHRVDGLPVVDDRNLVVGILTNADLLQRVRRQGPFTFNCMLYAFVYCEEDEAVLERIRCLLESPITKLYTRNVITCQPEEHLADVAGRLVDHRLKRLPVVTAHGRLVGMLSRGDVMRAIWSVTGR